MHYLLSPKIINTNPLCLVKAEVVNNRSEPTVEASLGKVFKFCNNNIHRRYIYFNVCL